jgi:tetratricopeptide (TPR) repeat protein
MQGKPRESPLAVETGQSLDLPPAEIAVTVIDHDIRIGTIGRIRQQVHDFFRFQQSDTGHPDRAIPGQTLPKVNRNTMNSATDKKSAATFAIPVILLVMAGAGWYFLTNKGEPAFEEKKDGETAKQSGASNDIYSAFEKADWQAVESLCQQLLKKDEFNAEARFNLAFSLFRQGKHDEAIENYGKVTRYAEFRDYALYNMACLHALKNEVDRSAELLSEALNNGFSSARGIANQAELGPLESHPKYQEWIEQEDRNRGKRVRINRG